MYLGYTTLEYTRVHYTLHYRAHRLLYQYRSAYTPLSRRCPYPSLPAHISNERIPYHNTMRRDILYSTSFHVFLAYYIVGFHFHFHYAPARTATPYNVILLLLSSCNRIYVLLKWSKMSHDRVRRLVVCTVHCYLL